MTNSSPTHAPDATSIAQPTLDGSVGDGCRVLLIRHGRSADIIPGSMQSHDPPLHELGQEQATAVGNRLSALTLHGIYSSHLLRALHTAEAIAAHHSVTVDIFEDLEEIRLGDWSHGEFRRRAATQDPEFIAWSKTGRWDGIPNGEGDENFRNRVTSRILQLASLHPKQTIAVVCHGGVINAFLAGVLGTERTLWMMVENTSITTVKIAETISVLTLNDCHHLYDLVMDNA